MHLTKSDFLKYQVCPSYLWLWKFKKEIVPQDEASEIERRLEQVTKSKLMLENYSLAVYFDLISERLPVQRMFTRMSWMYLHLLLTMSIGLVAVGLLNMIEYVKYPESIDIWFITFPVAAFLVVVTAINATLQVRYKASKPLYRIAMLVALGSAAAITALGLLELKPVVTLAATWVLLTAPVMAGFLLWVRRRSRELSSTKAKKA